MSTSIPLSCYIHTPWCIKKCPYCDFNSHALSTNLPEEAYIQALIEDLKESIPQAQGRPLQSIFIGGGTPSLLSAAAYARLFNAMRHNYEWADDIEITLEANPGTVEQARFQDYYAIGINRISLGIQSFNDAQLKILGRIHGSDEAKRAIDAVTNAGFARFNVDLMFGLPNQSTNEALTDLTTALSFNPTHLSWYQLTLEPNTYFYRHPPKLPHDETIWEMTVEGRKMLEKNGLLQYEISAYSQEQQQCRHNLNYWQFGDYIGVGAGAHGKITNLSTQKITRYSKYKNPRDYLDNQKLFTEQEKEITSQELPFEFMLNALRLNKSVVLNLFTERTGLPIETLSPYLKKAISEGYLLENNGIITRTELGHYHLNSLLEIFIP